MIKISHRVTPQESNEIAAGMSRRPVGVCRMAVLRILRGKMALGRSGPEGQSVGRFGLRFVLLVESETEWPAGVLWCV